MKVTRIAIAAFALVFSASYAFAGGDHCGTKASKAKDASCCSKEMKASSEECSKDAKASKECSTDSKKSSKASNDAKAKSKETSPKGTK